ncbi:MAG: hypothetical protein JXA03_15690 [Bacteroidales bacterium]|nr:hypothetical protein [Bacteroidales bacterium]
MGKTEIFIGNSRAITTHSRPEGRFVEIENEKYYQITDYHEMPDFFISIVSDSDHWMFISSNGSLSAGRKNRDNALFPYYTEDKIHDFKDKTGSKSYFLADKGMRACLWEPFTDESRKFYRIKRNLYKSIYGNKIIFEEINEDLELIFKYGWFNSEKFGFVKKASLKNFGKKKSRINILDGIQNILPYGVNYAFQNEFSNLLDAYRKNELMEGSTLGLFTLSSIPVDRAEPSESLKATTVWSAGFEGKEKILLSDKQINNFRNGLEVESEYDIRALRGAYFINASVELAEEESRDWITMAEINQDSTQVVNLKCLIKSEKNPGRLISEDIEKGTLNLKKLVSLADGFQKTSNDLCCARHYSNTLFNIMRGGVFANNYWVGKNDYMQYIRQINKLVFKEFQSWLEKLPEEITYMELTGLVEETGNPDLVRITFEYLPLIFSRRHGDPSRPWNIFSIETQNADGSAKYNYEGNWRDIFQNWEALSYSFPGFVEGIICKFVNASTVDGYNPYRIMRDGIDWECPAPEDPWSYIGYWGDHQIIYLQKLLELSNAFHPRKLDNLLTREIFTYSNVPYRIKSYDEIIKNPKDTVVFDEKLNHKIRNEAAHLGADASLLKNKAEEGIYKVNLTEKILVTLLSKISNFIPEAGIWMNTQRPEWNDANNALVGNGASMVTLYYLRRFLTFWKEKFNTFPIREITVSEEVASLYKTIFAILKENEPLLSKGFTATDRKKFMDKTGMAHGRYRNEIYSYSFSGEKRRILVSDLLQFINLCLSFVDHSVEKNKREDGMYHAYNLISISNDSVHIRHLYEMLEGQVAVLSSGCLSANESMEVLNALKNSKMFTPGQYSYMLYPDRQLPRFSEKNLIPAKLVRNSALLGKLLEDKEPSVIQMDDEGNYHFNGAFRNAGMLVSALNDLRVGSYSHMIEKEMDKILQIYEEVFDHKSFTGRSGTFYGYEGLGSIYWHMVSKLLLAAQENYFNAIDKGASFAVISRLKEHYYEIKAGIGLYKEPALYGAFPTDAYSHTPANSGVKQPGLTGQVKEDFISRLIEMGIHIREGMITFNTSLLNHEELLDHPAEFGYFTLDGNERRIELKQNQLAYTFCLTPIICTRTDKEEVTINYSNGGKSIIAGRTIDFETSSQIFKRTGAIELIEVSFKSI